MARISNQNYQRRVMLVMTAYVAVMLLVWPLARDAQTFPAKIGLALTPVVPMLYLLWLMVERVRHSDELEQRTHLIGLAVATAVVAVFSLVGGFLAAARALSLETCAALMLWTFPVLMLTYSAAQRWTAHVYGGGGCDDASSGAYRRLLIPAMLIGLTALWSYFHSADAYSVGFLAGMAVALAAGGALLALRRWRARRRTGSTL